MKVVKLNIERKQSYDSDYPNQLVGMTTIKGAHGTMEVKLSNIAVAKIFSVIKKDVHKVAQFNASQVNDSIDDAEAEVKLIDDIY